MTEDQRKQLQIRAKGNKESEHQGKETSKATLYLSKCVFSGEISEPSPNILFDSGHATHSEGRAVSSLLRALVSNGFAIVVLCFGRILMNAARF